MSFTEKIDVLELLTNLLKENEEKLETLIKKRSYATKRKPLMSDREFQKKYFVNGFSKLPYELRNPTPVVTK